LRRELHKASEHKTNDKKGKKKKMKREKRGGKKTCHVRESQAGAPTRSHPAGKIIIQIKFIKDRKACLSQAAKNCKPNR